MVELMWDGKYDANGKRVAPLRVSLPFQTVETVNESNVTRNLQLFSLLETGETTEWRNRLIWGDKKYVLPSLLEEFAGKVDLIYIDPPFNVGSDFSFVAEVGDERFKKEPSVIEQKAYRDTWGKGLDGYLNWFYDTVVLLHELLAPNGSLYVHLDWNVGSYAEVILDEVFGQDNYRNQIIWKRTSARSDSHTYNHIHDIIFLYTKSSSYTFNTQYTPYDQSYLDNFYRYIDSATGKKFRVSDLMAAGTRKGSSGLPWRGIDPNLRGNHWKYTIEKLDELDKEGRIYWPQKEGGVPGYKRYLDEMPGIPLQSIWTDISPLAGQSVENTNYSTQKPESLLDRIISSSSNKGDLVLDCFCGSGTTAAVAEKLGRRWITCDLGRFAIHTARKRLLAIPDVKPFVVQNLGKYERQAWQASEFGSDERAAVINAQYRKFILDLYHAEPLTGGTIWLHGKKAGRLVHIGTVDSPITNDDVTKIAIEFRKSIGTGTNAPKVAGVDILGWDFALEINETRKQIAERAGLDVRFLRIPREVLEKKAVEQGDIRFFELAALSVDAQRKGRNLALSLTDFMVPSDDVPAEVIAAVKKWSEWIDYWAVDWDFQGDSFHNQWQSYRTRKDRALNLKAEYTYPEPGKYTVVVKVIDILGNDTTKALEIEVV